MLVLIKWLESVDRLQSGDRTTEFLQILLINLNYNH